MILTIEADLLTGQKNYHRFKVLLSGFIWTEKCNSLFGVVLNLWQSSLIEYFNLFYKGSLLFQFFGPGFCFFSKFCDFSFNLFKFFRNGVKKLIY